MTDNSKGAPDNSKTIVEESKATTGDVRFVDDDEEPERIDPVRPQSSANRVTSSEKRPETAEKAAKNEEARNHQRFDSASRPF